MNECEPTLNEAIHNQNFRILLRDFLHTAMTWDAFLEHPLPLNMSPLATWTTLGSIGQCMGVHLFPTVKSEMLWYRRTNELETIVDDIERNASESSPLSKALKEHTDQDFITNLRLTEACAASQLADLAYDRNELDTHLRTNTEPKQPAGKLIANMVKIDANLWDYIDQPLSNALLQEMKGHLLRNLDSDDQAHLPGDGENRLRDEQEGESISRQLDLVISYATNDDEEDFVILRGNLLADAIRNYQPFGMASTQIASLASRLFYLQHGLPGLSLLPISAAKLQWLNGEMPSNCMLCSPDEYESTRRRSPNDLTVHQMLSAQCINRALDDLTSTVDPSNVDDQAAHELLDRDPQLNHRQRSILTRALRLPHAEFRIRYHQKKHNISYATARRDLVELKTAGYLRIEQRGKTFVFLAGERTNELFQNL